MVNIVAVFVAVAATVVVLLLLLPFINAISLRRRWHRSMGQVVIFSAEVDSNQRAGC